MEENNKGPQTWTSGLLVNDWSKFQQALEENTLFRASQAEPKKPLSLQLGPDTPSSSATYLPSLEPSTSEQSQFSLVDQNIDITPSATTSTTYDGPDLSWASVVPDSSLPRLKYTIGELMEYNAPVGSQLSCEAVSRIQGVVPFQPQVSKYFYPIRSVRQPLDDGSKGFEPGRALPDQVKSIPLYRQL
ncbi:hypothetical protein DFQ28_001019 [Apophysomyces sp. BC1034]|nr:hypothetical protein DFQ29_009904 [Apophysomyces sp. BC1021]KAG0191067.1 hypothetical protein DFQ28_001019 [Apophysomyces sp. BC1034]